MSLETIKTLYIGKEEKFYLLMEVLIQINETNESDYNYATNFNDMVKQIEIPEDMGLVKILGKVDSEIGEITISNITKKGKEICYNMKIGNE